jgi:hypothetical protein
VKQAARIFSPKILKQSLFFNQLDVFDFPETAIGDKHHL